MLRVTAEHHHDAAEPDRTDARADTVTPALLDVVLTDASIESHLAHVASMAADLDPAIGGCGVTVRRGGRPSRVAASHPLAGAVDEVQLAAGEGPALESLATGAVLVVEDYEADRRWPRYGRHVVARGVRSSMSVPLQVTGATVGVLSAYGREPDVFTQDVRDTLLRFAGQAEGLVAVTLRNTTQADELLHLHTAMDSRSVIDQALGVLMAQQRCTADEAFALLQAASQSRNRRVAQIAADIVTTVSGAPPRTGRFRS
ncbi:GAF and ANTAR domain-containing protein [Cellulomonas sp. 179-A 9B4 NHS]|uniref:GAF and ANTAR domain-containing protein n=1 Tax=Cellulomonas sp. 179-A 9B4 NHS TaxID=3142379 RepID=UPI0039A00753